MKIESQIKREVRKGPLVAYADVTVGDALVIHGVRLMQNDRGMFASMPQTSWTDRNGEVHYEKIVTAVGREISNEISRSVREAYDAYEQERMQNGSEEQDEETDPEAEQEEELFGIRAF